MRATTGVLLRRLPSRRASTFIYRNTSYSGGVVRFYASKSNKNEVEDSNQPSTDKTSNDSKKAKATTQQQKKKTQDKTQTSATKTKSDKTNSFSRDISLPVISGQFVSVLPKSLLQMTLGEEKNIPTIVQINKVSILHKTYRDALLGQKNPSARRYKDQGNVTQQPPQNPHHGV